MVMSRQTVPVGEALQVGQPGHAQAVLGDHLAQHAGGGQPGHAGQVDGRLGVAGPLQDPAVAGPQHVEVAGAGQVVGPGAAGRPAPGPSWTGPWPRCRSSCRGGSRRSR